MKQLRTMKTGFCVVLLLCGQSFARIISPLEWQNYSLGEETMMGMIYSKGRVSEENLQQRSANDEPWIADEVNYYLYTKEKPYPHEITKDNAELLKSSTFDPAKKTKVLIHGFLNDHMKPVDVKLSEAYLNNQDVNIISVDWGKLASPLYNLAVGYTQPVGEEVAKLIDFLVTAGGANVSDIHILGHSLGAHVAAFTANNVKSGRITRISGLDPALPLFGGRPPALRLDPLDADIVDCIHTCGGYLGFYEPLCTHDFYPNGGAPVQAGCGFDWDGGCSHARSFELFASSIDGNKFTAQACASFQEIQMDFCTGSLTGLMGELAPTTPAGIYNLRTSGFYPYAQQ